jgi:hypothetical protein
MKDDGTKQRRYRRRYDDGGIAPDVEISQPCAGGIETPRRVGNHVLPFNENAPKPVDMGD